jgi:hypothetical protein
MDVRDASMSNPEAIPTTHPYLVVISVQGFESQVQNIIVYSKARLAGGQGIWDRSWM